MQMGQVIQCDKENINYITHGNPAETERIRTYENLHTAAYLLTCRRDRSRLGLITRLITVLHSSTNQKKLRLEF